MYKITYWVKNHKLICFLFIIVFYLLAKESLFSFQDRFSPDSYHLYESEADYAPSLSKGSIGSLKAVNNQSIDTESLDESAPKADIQDRLVIKNSHLSLQVAEVVAVQKKVIQKAEELGGYMVNSSSRSQDDDAASASIIVRIPAIKLEDTLEYYRSLAVKIVSENLQGRDVSDQYTDFETQLKTYEKTKLIFEKMLDKATDISDILRIQREIINIQNSIDSIKGQQDYLKKNAEMVKITLYLSTDELALPYAPSNTWRPVVIFKQAVRSLIMTLRGFGSLLIWIAVYSVILIPLFFIFIIIKKRIRQKNNQIDIKR